MSEHQQRLLQSLRRLTAALCLLLAVLAHRETCAQHREVENSLLRVYGGYDNHYYPGAFFHLAATYDHRFSPYFYGGVGCEGVQNRQVVFLGIESSRLSLSMHYCIDLWQTDKTALYVENRYLLRVLAIHLNTYSEINSALLLGFRGRRLNVEIGACNRFYQEGIGPSREGVSPILEGLSAIFDMEAWLLPYGHKWNVGLHWSNCSDFVIERIGSYFLGQEGNVKINERLSVFAQGGISPVGWLNLTNMYNGEYATAGVQFNISPKAKHGNEPTALKIPTT